MNRHKVFGYAVILYGLVGGGIGSLFPSGGAALMRLVPVAFLAAYLTGGIGLVMRRRWARPAVLVTALAELAVNAVSQGIMAVVQANAGGGASPYLLIEAIAGLLPPGLIAYVAFQLGRPPRAAEADRAGRVVEGDRKLAVPARRQRQVFWGIVLIGAALPWIVGAGEKLYLDVHGKATFPWSYFVGPWTLVWIVPVSAWFALAYLGLAYVARRVMSGPFWRLTSVPARMLFLLGSFVGGCVGTVWTFISVFREFDPLFVMLPLWAYDVPFMAGGAAVGYVAARIVDKRRVA
jgi:hypothetical protein